MARFNKTGVDVSFKAAGDLSSHQYKFMTLSAAETVNLCGANGISIGILQNQPDAAGEIARVRIIGISELIVGEGAARLKMLTSTSVGLGEIADAADEFVGAIALETAAAANDRIAVLITQFDAHSSDA